MTVSVAIGAGCFVWTYFGLVALRWDRHLGGTPADFSMLVFLLWWIVVLVYWRVRPSKPWRITDPPPSAAERVKLAQERSEVMERECGLVFDEVVLLPGYRHR
jgi:hypothetical protein